MDDARIAVETGVDGVDVVIGMSFPYFHAFMDRTQIIPVAFDPKLLLVILPMWCSMASKLWDRITFACSHYVGSIISLTHLPRDRLLIQVLVDIRYLIVPQRTFTRQRHDL
jgi:hypothetical protein